MSNDISVSKETDSKETHSTNLLVVMISLVLGLVSAAMLFVDFIEPEYVIYALALVLIVAGIIMIVRYFTRDAYRNINAYGFSIGILMIVLALCALLRATELIGAIVVVLGIVLLMMGIIMLQHSLDLNRMKDAVWGLFIVLAVIIMAAGVAAILQPGDLDYDAYIWWAVLISSALSVIVNIYTMIRVRIFKKKEAETPQETASDSASDGDEQTENPPSYTAPDDTPRDEVPYTPQIPDTLSDISASGGGSDSPDSSATPDLTNMNE